MAYLQQATPPPNKRMTFSLKSFTGGMNNRSDLLRDNEAHDTLNMTFTKSENTMEKRKGFRRVPDLEIPTDGMFSFIDTHKPYKDTDITIYASKERADFVSSRLFAYRHDYEGFLQHMDLGEIENAEQINGLNFQGRYFFANGDKLYAFGRFPLYVDSPYIKVIGSPGSYDDLDDQGYVFALFEVVSPDLDAERLGIEHTEGVMTYDYENQKCWYTPCENEFIDPYLGANVVPEGVRFLTSHKGRLFASGSDKDDDNIFLTDVQNPFYFPATLPLQVPPNSDRVTGLFVFDDSVIIGRRNDMHAIRGVTNNPTLGFDMFRLFKINTHTGFASNNAINIAHNYLFYMGYDWNMYAMSSINESEHMLQTSILSHQIDLRSAPFDDVTHEDVVDAKSHFANDLWYIQIGKHTLVYSYIHRAWTRFLGLNISCFDRNEGTKLRWSAIFTTTNEGSFGEKDIAYWGGFYEFGEDYLDESTVFSFRDGEIYEHHASAPFPALWASRRFDMDDASSFKQFKEFFIVSHTYDKFPSDVTVSFNVDFTEIKNTIDVTTRIAKFGRAMFGDRFITRNVNASTPVVIGRRGRNVQFILQNGETVNEALSNINEVEDKGRRVNGELIYTSEESKYYRYIEGVWQEVDRHELNQPMLVYQVNGEYEMRGKR